MLIERDLERISSCQTASPAPIALIYHSAADASPFGDALLQTARQVAAAAGDRISLSTDDTPGPLGSLCLTISLNHGGNIHYMAMPDGMEAPPFVEVLLDASADLSQGDRPWVEAAQGLADPAELIVFVAPACPHCPMAVRSALGLAMANAHISIIIVDAQHFSTLATEFQAKSVPMTVLDRGLSWTGVVSESDIIAKIASRSSATFDTTLFRSLVETGRFEAAADMLQAENGNALYLDRWLNSTTSSRIGLMMLAETALNRDPAVLNSIVSEIASATESEDAALRGDTADLLGQIGHPAAIPALKALLNDTNPDVVEIATEALSALC
ncbi:MAG: thioredoxin family protein [Myxococcota bacterium]|nr:thioredoxin family protein [Myxococcota bacterium]